MNDSQPTGKSSWILRSAGIASAIVVFISTTLGIFIMIEGRMKEAMSENTQRLTLEIKQSAVDLAGMHRDDLEVRIRIKRREIEAKRNAGDLVPERLSIELEALQDQLSEVKEKWFAH